MVSESAVDPSIPVRRVPLKDEASPVMHRDSRPGAQALWARRLTLEARFEKVRLHTLKRKVNHFGSLPLFRALLWATGLREQGERNALSPVLRNIELEFESLPAAFDGFRILHASDFHFDGRTDFTDILCALLDPVKVDLCVLTGDYRFLRYGPVDHVVNALGQVRNCIHARHGIVGVLGNHDTGEMGDAFGELGMRILVNEHIEISEGDQSLWLLGLDDPHDFRCDDLSLALENVPSEAFKILLVHTPEAYREAANLGIDLYLCGHTHWGQIRFPIVGPVTMSVRCPRRLCGGRWRHQGVQGYTTAGLGTTDIPVRFRCPPEAVVITLVKSTR